MRRLLTVLLPMALAAAVFGGDLCRVAGDVSSRIVRRLELPRLASVARRAEPDRCLRHIGVPFPFAVAGPAHRPIPLKFLSPARTAAISASQAAL